jgi:aryl-phospho-beta-D-glucosidase BglC (GH1 family)
MRAFYSFFSLALVCFPSLIKAYTCNGSLTKFTYFGVNEAGAEFGNTNVPGVLGTDYTWPTEDSIDVSLPPPGCPVLLR